MASIQPGSSSHSETLRSTLGTPWKFLTPTDDLHAIVTQSTKSLLDPLATSVVHGQSLRRQINKKRKISDDESSYPNLQLKSLYIEGFTPHQIWEQATRILEAAAGEVDRDISSLVNDSYESSDDDHDPSVPADSVLEEEEESDAASHESDDMLYDEELAENDGLELDDEDEEEEISSLEEEGLEDEDPEASEEDPGTFVEDRFGLNDGFFSIDDFNKQSEFLERQDAKGEAEDEDDSDEEVNWHSNPLDKNNIPPQNEDAGADSEDEEGPTFGNVDLYAPSDDDNDDDEAQEMNAGAPDWVDTSDIKYADFFAPPPRKASSKKFRALPKTQPETEIQQGDVDRAMADVRRDLFDEESEIEDDEPGVQKEGPQSTHEKQRAQIADEIRRLEAASVAKKEWMLTGEARAPERPVNSLIEEDLDFERVGKPVPVVTNETTEDIEELVKRRILAKEFDEVIRRRPGAIESKTSRSRFELEDTKPQQSLAELYEADHLKATDPNYSDAKDKKLLRDHAEITNLWKEISSQLDTLSNWHYKPKAPQASINVVADAPTIMMEEARPAAGALGESSLAPQEIYAPGDDGKNAGEVVLKTGASVAKDEMSREEKARARRQQKKNKRGENDNKSKKGTATQLVSDLKKGGVKMVNKEGKVTEMDGGKVETSAKNSADTLKL